MAFKRFATDKRYLKLVDRIWSATKYSKLEPSDDPFTERLQHLTSVYQQINIEQAHNMPLLQNNDGIQVFLCGLPLCSLPQSQARPSLSALPKLADVLGLSALAGAYLPDQPPSNQAF